MCPKYRRFEPGWVLHRFSFRWVLSPIFIHHRYFEVNYGGDGLVPLDKLFGTWHDGSKESDARMKERFRKKKERLKAKQAATAAE